MTGMHIDIDTYHSYPLEVAGLRRDLPICRVSDSLYIAAFVIFGDVELTKACASELIKKLPPYDVLITAEAKGIPLVYEWRASSATNAISSRARRSSCI